MQTLLVISSSCRHKQGKAAILGFRVLVDSWLLCVCKTLSDFLTVHASEWNETASKHRERERDGRHTSVLIFSIPVFWRQSLSYLVKRSWLFTYISLLCFGKSRPWRISLLPYLTSKAIKLPFNFSWTADTRHTSHPHLLSCSRAHEQSIQAHLKFWKSWMMGIFLEKRKKRGHDVQTPCAHFARQYQVAGVCVAAARWVSPWLGDGWGGRLLGTCWCGCE